MGSARILLCAVAVLPLRNQEWDVQGKVSRRRNSDQNLSLTTSDSRAARVMTPFPRRDLRNQQERQ